MIAFLKHLAEKWQNWIGDRDLEMALRRHLDKEEFYGDSAQFRNMKLAAVQRPGWLQVFLFEVTAKSRIGESYVELFGIVRQDERFNKTEIKTFSRKFERSEIFQQWSEGLIKTRRSR